MATTALAIGIGAAAAALAVRKAKKKLARYLAKSLSEYFDVDPHLVESSLGGDTKLVLQEARLKPFVPFTGARVEGLVDRVEFSWNWGGSEDGSTAYVRNAALTIRGARVRVIMTKNAVSVSTDRPDNAAAADEKEEETDASTGETIQQIIDSLALNITDLELVVEIEEQPVKRNLVCEFKSLNLVSLGRESEGDVSLPQPPLLQTISLDSLCAYVESEEGKLYLLDPFGYTASIKRVAGKRFGGLDTGLHIYGKKQQDITIRAGRIQVETLAEIMDMLPSSEESSSSPDDSTPEDQVDDPYSTVMYLPLPSMKVILPNGSAIRLPDFRFRFCTDGTVCILQSTEGMFVNEDYHFIRFDGSASCTIDFTSNKFLLESTSGTLAESEVELVYDQNAKGEQSSSPHVPGVAHISWQESEMRPLIAEIREVMELMTPGDSSKDQTLASKETKNPSDSSALRPWSFSLDDGKISIRIDGESQTEKQWILASFDAPSSYVLPDRPDEAPSKISIGGITVGPTSFGDVLIRSSGVTFEAGAFPLSSVNNMQEFVTKALGLDVW